MFDSDSAQTEPCIFCGGCVDVCPQGCISIQTLSSLRLTSDDGEAIRYLTRMSDDAAQEEKLILLKIEDDCTHCGLCSRRCPVGAIREAAATDSVG